MVVRGFRKVRKPSADVRELKRLIDRWREPGLQHVCSHSIVPDTSNRGHTGLSVDHVHLIASSMLKDGFRERPPHGKITTGPQGQPHDVPVLVRGGPACPVAVQSLEDMRAMCHSDPDFPRVTLAPDCDEWYCSLGNGHFTQAMNLFRQRAPNKFTSTPFAVPSSDAALARALAQGVPSVVLRADMPLEERRRVAHLLNATHEYKWTVDKAGAVDISPENCCLERFTQFEALSKTLDRETLGRLVRSTLGLLGDGTIPVAGMRVIATDSSFYDYYRTGHGGVIARLTVSDPVVRWDHSGQERRADRGKLQCAARAAARPASRMGANDEPGARAPATGVSKL